MLMQSIFSALSPAGERARLSVLIFHRVLPIRDQLFPDECDAERFERIVGWLAQWFNVLPLDQAVERLKRGSLPARAAAISFDDGYADNYAVATPILKKLGVPATFFVATGFLDGGRMWNDTVIEAIRGARASELGCRAADLAPMPIATVNEKREAINRFIPAIKHLPRAQRDEAVAEIAEAARAVLPSDLMMSSEQVRELRHAGMGIGAHTVTHPILATLDATSACAEIAHSRDVLADLLKERVGLFAYPNGKAGQDYTREHVDIVSALGFDAAVSTNWGAARRESDFFQLPRFTPWDKGSYRFGLRLAGNYRRHHPGA